MARMLKSLVIFGAALFFSWLLLPKPSLYGDTTFSSAVWSRNGDLLRLTLAEDERYRLFTPLFGLPAEAMQATLLYEDRAFFYHPGINPWSVLRALWSTATGQRTVGASTLSMQLARLRFALDSSTVAGKLEQMLRAVQLERHYSKHELLEAYLNLAPYGGNIEGLGAASLIYFGKPAHRLTLPEILTLVVVPQNPRQRNPNRENSAALVQARERLLQLWVDKYPQHNQWLSRASLPVATRNRSALPFRAPHFAERVLQENGAGNWHTTLDTTLQGMLEQHTQRYLAERQPDGMDNAAALIVDVRDMSVAAWLGSGNWHDDEILGQVDGVSAQRSPGSTLKPFVYALAIEQGLVHPQSLLRDLPLRFGAYTPENFDRGFLGPVTAKDALIYSRNVPAVALAGELASPGFHQFLQRAGIAQLRAAEFYGLALVLGGMEISMRELAELYGALANGGIQHSMALLQQQAVARPGVRLLTPEAAFITLQMLAETPRFARHHSFPVAWKTGTSWAFRDAWAIGLAGHYLLAVWVGNFDGRGNPAFVGRDAAAPLFFRVLEHLALEQDLHELQGLQHEGLNVRQINVCAADGGLPGRHCPEQVSTWYIPGVSPIRVSNIHREVVIDPATGLRACDDSVPGLKREVMEFWPSDLAALFRLAGLPRRAPPPYAPHCRLDAVQSGGFAPRIQSPLANLEYGIRPNHPEPENIPLRAITDADTQTLFWFADDAFIGQSNSREVLLWQAEPGRYLVRAVDDLGRSDTVPVTVRLLPGARQ